MFAYFLDLCVCLTKLQVWLQSSQGDEGHLPDELLIGVIQVHWQPEAWHKTVVKELDRGIPWRQHQHL